MIAIDTNILVRYAMRDDAIQAELSRQLLQEQLSPSQPGFVSIVALVEFFWVLRTSFGIPNALIVGFAKELRSIPHIVIERDAAVEEALSLPHGDFADSLLHALGKSAGCTATYTFDRRFARLEGVELLDPA